VVALHGVQRLPGHLSNLLTGSPPLLGIRRKPRRSNRLPGRQRPTLPHLRQLLHLQQRRPPGDSLLPVDGAPD
jgi:hypothetical protein